MADLDPKKNIPEISCRILVVDDDPAVLDILRSYLSAFGYEHVAASNGLEAVEELQTDIFDVVITDLNMPVMDGIAFLKEVKQLPAYKFTPVIMLTTESAESKKREGQAAGARAWVVKPFQPEQLIEAVRRLCLP